MKEAYLKIVDSITNSNQEILTEFSNCINNPRQYYQDNYLTYKDIGINEYTTDDEIQFEAMLELLEKNDYCAVIDWKCYLDEFIYSIENLKNAQHFNKENLGEDEDVFIWCDKINKELKKQNKCIAEVFTKGDYLVVFFCSSEQLKHLSSLAKECNREILKLEYTEQEKNNEDKRYYNRIVLKIYDNKEINPWLAMTLFFSSLGVIVFLIYFLSNNIISNFGWLVGMVTVPIIYIGLLYAMVRFVASLPDLREKIKISRFYKMENGELGFNFIESVQESELDELKEKNAFIIYEENNNIMLNFMYNWLNNNDLLKNIKINSYILDKKKLCKKFKVKTFTTSQKVICINFKDLNITPKNIEAIREAHKYVKAMTLEQIIDKYSKKSMEKE